VNPGNTVIDDDRRGFFLAQDYESQLGLHQLGKDVTDANTRTGRNGSPFHVYRMNELQYLPDSDIHDVSPPSGNVKTNSPETNADRFR